MEGWFASLVGIWLAAIVGSDQRDASWERI